MVLYFATDQYMGTLQESYMYVYIITAKNEYLEIRC